MTTDTISLAVWDMPMPVVAGEKFSIKIGAKSASSRGLAGRRVEVSDSGPGIKRADRERVFDRFYRRAAAQESGTGLGLAIVKTIAERHGAQISLDDAPGGGLLATVRFPKPS